ncbi:hypothetical protein ACFWNK_01865 [Streptomyces sp. NPDC058417]|uniref:hypothetical protein n=1 Tax=unclassified Streptomyces TaxID=2593676 RepID=UPI00365937C4
MPENRTAVLLVDSYTTQCSRCRRGAYIKDTRHDRIATGLGTPDPRDKPCGARFVAISTLRLGYPAAEFKGLRPDLPAYDSGEVPPGLTT